MKTGHQTITVTIANGGTTSAAVNLQGKALRGIHMPGTWTAADITFTASPTETGTYNAVHYSTGEAATAIAAVTVKTPVASRYIPMTSHAAVALVSPGWLKVVSSASQGGDRTLYLEVVEA